MEPQSKHIAKKWWVTPLLILVLLWGVGHSSYVLTSLANYVLSGLVESGSRFSVARVEGSLFSRVRIHDLVLASASDSTTFRVESIEASFKLRKIFSLSLDEVRVSGIDTRIQKIPAGAFVLPTFKPSSGGDTAFALGLLSVQNVRVEITEGDSTRATIEEAEWKSQDINVSGAETSFKVDTLWARVNYPETQTKGTLGLRVEFGKDKKGKLDLAALSERSSLNVSASGSFDSLSVKGANSWMIHANGGFSSADLAPFVPGLSTTERFTVSAETAFKEDSTSIRGRISTLAAGTLDFSSMSRQKSDSLFHALRVSVTDIEVGRLFKNLRSISGISATVTGNGTGASFDEVTGNLDVLVSAATWDKIKLGTSEISLERGLGSVTSTFRVNTTAGTVLADASLNDDGHFDISGRTSRVDMSRVSPELPSSRLNTRFSASGQFQDDTLSRANLSVQFAPSSVGTCHLEKGSVTGQFSPVSARIQTALDVCSDEPLVSVITITNPTKEWRISSTSSVKGLQISDLFELEETVSLDANAVVDFAKSGRVLGSVDVFNLTYGQTVLDSIGVEIKGTSANLVADANMALGGGLIAANLSLKNQTQLLIGSGSVKHLDAFKLSLDSLRADSSSYSSDLTGTFSGEVNFGAAGPEGKLNMQLLASRVNRQVFDSTIEALWTPDTASANVHVTSADSTSLQAEFGLEIASSLAHTTIQLNGWDIFPLLNLDGRSELVGQLIGSATLTEDVPFEMDLDIQNGSSLNRVNLQSLTSNLRGTASEISGLIDLSLEQGRVRGSFEMDSLHAKGHVLATDTDVAALLGIKSPSRLSTSIEWMARRSDLDWDQFDIRVDSLSADYEHVVVQSGSGVVHLSPTRIQVDSLDIRGSFGAVTANGTLPRTSGMDDALLTYSIRVNNELSRISQLQDLNLGFFSAEAVGTFEGPFGQTRLSSTFNIMDALGGGLMANQISGRLLGEFDSALALSAAELVADVHLIEIDPVIMESATVTASYDGAELVTSVDINIEENRSVSTTVSWLPFEAPKEFTLLGLNAFLDGDEWKMTGSSTFDSEIGTLSNPIVLLSGEQRIVAISSVSDGAVRALVTVQKLKIDPFADLLTFPDLGGVIGGTLTATTLKGEIELQGNLLGSISAFGKAVGDLNFQFSDDGQWTRLNAGLRDLKGESLQLSGTVPRFDTQNEVQIQLSAASYSIDWIRSLLDPELIDELKGRVNGEIRISGTPTQPSWSGVVRLKEGTLGLRSLGKRKGMLVTNIQSNFRFNGEVIEVDSLRARSGDGWLRGSGTIDIKDLKLGEYNIAITASDFKAIDSPDYFAVVSGQLTLGGTTDRPKIGGRITVNRGDFWLSDATTSDTFEPLTLSDEDLNVLQRRFGLRIAPTDTTTFDAYDVLALENFTVRMERDTWIRSKSNPRMDIQLTGDLDVRKLPKQDPEVFGSITVLPERSRIIQFGKRFELDRGELTFNGPMNAPNMNMEASYSVPSRNSDTEEVTIRLIAQGSPENLEVSFASDPTMELADIVSYIATGRPAAASLQISGSQTDTYLQSAAGLAIGPVADLIENMASAGLGLDVIEIEHTGFSGLTLTAGKYVSPRLYVSVSQPISLSTASEVSTTVNKNQTQVTMEYELVRQLLLSLLNRGTILRVNLRWQHAF